jgi:phage-related tail fiber protein
VSLHKNVTAGDVHIANAFVFANAAARIAGTGYTIVPADVGKIARQTDNETFWILTDDSPITWSAIDAAGSVPTTRTLTAGAGLTGGGDLSADRTFDVVANADGSIIANADDVQVGVLATDAQHGVRGGGTQHPAATPSVAGFMSATDKGRFDDYKVACRLSAVGNHGLSGLAAIDGVTPIAGDRILVNDQTTASQNGIYVAAAGAWSRATDADTTGEITPETRVIVKEGTARSNTFWICTNTTNPTIGTDAIAFAQFNRPLVIYRFIEAGAFRLPVTADAAVNAFAALTPSSLNSMLLEHNFDDTTEEGVIWQERTPLSATRLYIEFKARAQTPIAAARTVGLKLYYRRMQSGVAVGAWNSLVLTDFSIPSNASSVYIVQGQTITFAAMATPIVLGDDYQYELTRINPTGGTELVGDWNLQRAVFIPLP